MAGRVEHLAAQPVRRGSRRCARRRGPHPGVLDDRGQVDVVDVGGPVDDPGVEAERRLVGLVEPLEAGQQAVDAVDRLALGVGPVQLDVAEGPLGLLARSSSRADHSAWRPRRGRAWRVDSARSMAWSWPAPAGAGPGPGRGTTSRARRWAGPRCRTGPLGEPLPHQVDEVAVAQRVGGAGGDLGDGGLVGRPAGGGVDDRGDHQVDGDDVDGPLGHAGELLEQARA